jgi:hypothetical protein
MNAERIWCGVGQRALRLVVRHNPLELGLPS